MSSDLQDKEPRHFQGTDLCLKRLCEMSDCVTLEWSRETKLFRASATTTIGKKHRIAMNPDPLRALEKLLAVFNGSAEEQL